MEARGCELKKLDSNSTQTAEIWKEINRVGRRDNGGTNKYVQIYLLKPKGVSQE
jgi:hypothetical protein